MEETNAIFQTINSNFNMNQTEFMKMYSENMRKNLINNIKDRFITIIISLNNEIKNMKHNIKNEFQQLNCHETNPGIFKNNFQNQKQRINNIIENISDNIEKYYIDFQKAINQLIKDFQIGDSIKKEKTKINLMRTIRINHYFKNNINFEYMNPVLHFIINAFSFFIKHKYEDDIKNKCLEYKNMIYSGYESIDNNLLDRFKELNNKGIDLINLIFNTANSNFVELKKNKIKYDEIIKIVNKILKNNN